ncbi:MAG: hypothetical protein JW994_00280 [Candidatus Omnitrophica bacterium]|nr:hypothetical protein [Candidatus Omnitrophota bacterium]
MNLCKTPHKRILILFVIMIALLAGRYITIAPTLNENHIGSFRLGTIPTNDASRWAQYAEDLLDGRKIPIRPLFPLFLTNAFFFFGDNFTAHACLFVFLNVFSILAAAYILRSSINNIYVVFLLALLSAWRIFFLPDIMSENLAIPLYIIATACIIRSLFSHEYGYMLIAFLLLATGQMVRPWDFVSLAVFPLFPVVNGGIKKRTLYLFLAGSTAIALGVSIHFTGSKLFSKESPTDNMIISMVLYGQSSGGEGGNYWIRDRELRNKRYKIGQQEWANLAYSKALDNIRTNPGYIIKAVKRSYGWLFISLPKFFAPPQLSPPYYFLVFLLLYLFYLFDTGGIKKAFLPAGKNRLNYVFLAIGFTLVMLYEKVFFIVLAAVGFFYIYGFCRRRFKIFLSLLLFDIVITMAIFGGSGLERYAISVVLLLFNLAAAGLYGISVFLLKNQHTKARETVSKNFVLRGADFIRLIAVYTALVIMFIAFPFTVRALKPSETWDIDADVTKDFFRSGMGIGGEVLSENDLLNVIFQWPEVSTEKINNKTVFIKRRYRSFMGREFDKNEGLEYDKTRYFDLWPFSTLRFRRIIYEEFIILPKVNKKDLKQFEGKEVVFIGKIIGIKRPRFTSRACAVVVTTIVYKDKNGRIAFLPLGEFSSE